MNLNYHFGAALKKYLKKHGITQVFLANKLEVEPPTISNYIKTKHPQEDTVKNILNALEITEEELFVDDTNAEEPKVEYKLGTKVNGMIIISEQQYQRWTEMELKMLRFENEKLKQERRSRDLTI